MSELHSPLPFSKLGRTVMTKSSILNIILFMAALLSSGSASGGKLRPPPQPMRALQVMNLECTTPAALDARLEAFKQANVQAIILRVFHNPGDAYYGFIKPRAKVGVYFKTEAAPVVGDALGLVCERAHKKGIQVFAWMTTRYANYGHEDETELRCLAWDFEQGKAAPSKGYSPLLPAVQDRLANLFGDLARYPIDGVLLQDDLMLRHNEDFNPAVVKLYREQTGQTADPARFFKTALRSEGGKFKVHYTEEFRSWRRWQNRGLLALAERLRATVQQARPNTPVGLNLYYETLTAGRNSLDWRRP
jgi:poly-beta-1,6-N-acetyl-D-glucosamine N-deacetylase